jgi:hypothetical protein
VCQSLLADNLDDLIVQVAAEFDLHSVSGRQAQDLRELLGVAGNYWSNFLQRASP